MSGDIQFSVRDGHLAVFRRRLPEPSNCFERRCDPVEGQLGVRERLQAIRIGSSEVSRYEGRGFVRTVARNEG
jgi:hypothetical protein